MTSQFESLTTAASCGVKSSWELCGCAEGVAYVQLVSMSGTDHNVVWVNTETGEVETTKPTGFVTGTCQDAAAPVATTDEFVVEADGLTSFTLTATPKGAVFAFRNGARMPVASMVFAGAAVTYVPLANGGNALLTGNRITFDYFA